MMIEVKAPNSYRKQQLTIFLAGSIDMGVAEFWQDRLVKDLMQKYLEKDILLLNPRRDDWDDSWVQSIRFPQFKQQVDWELAGLENADIVAVYFAPDAKSPITLLELGLFARSKKVIVCCPDRFWKKGNVEIVCERYGIPLFGSYTEFVAALSTSIDLYLADASKTFK